MLTRRGNAEQHDGDLMPFATEGKFRKLSWWFSPRLRKAGLALRSDAAPSDNAWMWQRFALTNILPFVGSLLLVGAATLALFPLSHFFEANLATIAYLIPVMTAATRPSSRRMTERSRSRVKALAAAPRSLLFCLRR